MKTKTIRYLIWMFDDSNQDGYPVDVFTDGWSWIRIVVPVDPLRYNGMKVKPFTGKPEARGWRFKEVDGRDQIAFSQLFDIGRYDGIQERCPLKTKPKSPDEWRNVCSRLHENMSRAS